MDYYYSYTKNTKISFLLASMLMMFVLSTSDNAKDKQECTESLVGLATCLPYVGGNAKNPTPDCCSGLKTVLKTNKKCLCVVIHDRNDPDLGLTINVTLALGLPNVCDAPANVSQCPALLKLPPNSPDAQVFYQLDQKSSNSPNASSPVAEGPTTHGMSNPISAPRSVAQQNSGGCGDIKAWLGWEIIGGLILLSSFIGM